MAKRLTSQTSSGKKDRKLLPVFCNVLGTLILLGVIVAFLPMAAPALLGYEAYEVVSGSMEPEISIGSVIYVKPEGAGEFKEGDIIAFQRENSVVTHRVVENHMVEGELITKGDANQEEDLFPVAYAQVIGKVTWHMPILGTIMTLLTSKVGKIYAVLFAACGVMLHMLAGSMRAQRREKE